jgi:tRNA modification GTPase
MSTISALSTPRGMGALSVVRLSGSHSLEILRRIVPDIASPPKPRTATLATIKQPGSGETIDEVLITFFPAPHSVTGEDVVEISCHGSPAVVRYLLDLTLTYGARLAEPGEFSLRALQNNKITLAQAEAVRDLIQARTQAAAKQAAMQLRGELSNTLAPLKSGLIGVIVVLESAVEFVEDDLPVTQTATLLEKLDFISSKLDQLSETFTVGRLMRDGYHAVILGQANVGKSSLFNSLIRHERAIVTDIPGTTRDTLSETIDISGVPVTLTDTAGLRETADGVESLGIERTHRAASEADLLLLVFDGTCEVGPAERKILSATRGPDRILIVNKCDEPTVAWIPEVEGSVLNASAKTGFGLDELRQTIASRINGSHSVNEGLIVTNARHYDLLRHAFEELKSAQAQLRLRTSEELVLVPLHNALKYLGEITGETTTEQILSEIFSTFCIGK